MNFSRTVSLATLVGALSLPVACAWAHDFWIDRDSAGFHLQRGHVGGPPLPLDAKKVVGIRCLQTDGKRVEVLTDTRFEPTQATTTAACSVISAVEDGGTYCLTPDGEKNLPKSQVPDAVKSWRSKQFAKWLDARSSLQAKPMGDEFEVVPVTDLAKVKIGDKATFRMLLQGKPVAGAILSIDHKGIGESDEEGLVRVRLRPGRTMTVAASVRRPLKSPEADTEVFEASLTFEVWK